MKLNSSEFLLIKIAILSRCLTVIWCFLLDSLFEDYDMSSLLIFPKKDEFGNFFKTFLRWDSLYFSEIFEKGYTFDKFHVFFPFYPLVLIAIQNLFSPILFSNKIENLILIGISLNLILNCISCVLLYRFFYI